MNYLKTANELKNNNNLRECELKVAISESKKDMKNGKYIQESVKDHIKRIKKVE